MLLYDTLFNKATLTDSEEGEFVDLLSDSLKPYTSDTQEWTQLFSGAQQIVVSKYYVARPDLISLAIFKDDKYADLICKVNGISNPFELNENMIILIPDRYKLEALNLEFASSPSSVLSESNQSDSTVANTKKTNQKLKSERRSPAEATLEDSNYTVDYSLGMVFY